MNTTKHVLLVTNAVTETELCSIKDALNRTAQDGMQIKLSLVHVIPNLPTCYFNIPSMVMLAERYYEEAKKCLTTVGDTLGIVKENQWLITGRIKNEVLRLADKLDAHFILASSTNIQDFHKTFKFTKDHSHTVVQNISAISSL
jgi:hypothetical protein